MTGWRLTLVVHVAEWLVRALYATVRVRVADGQAAADAARSGGVVFAFWHAELLGFMVRLGPQRPHAMISQSKDGELIARISARFGTVGIRGSSSRGGAAALLAAVQLAKDGAMVGITPDGPRGPRHHLAPGVVKIAQRSQVPVIPVRFGYDRAWRLNSWDRFEIPKPFARMTIAYGVPQLVPADAGAAALEAACAALAHGMAAAGRAAGCAD
jgi:lysophospholipid acyltransferase (LPLAT)-like uncharacterized protein